MMSEIDLENDAKLLYSFLKEDYKNTNYPVPSHSNAASKIQTSHSHRLSTNVQQNKIKFVPKENIAPLKRQNAISLVEKVDTKSSKKSLSFSCLNKSCEAFNLFDTPVILEPDASWNNSDWANMEVEPLESHQPSFEGLNTPKKRNPFDFGEIRDMEISGKKRSPEVIFDRRYLDK